MADVVPLVGNNRVLASHGLKQLSAAPRAGLRALLRVADVRARRVRADHVAFQLAPRLNAAGRLSSAGEALQLLTATDQATGQRLASRLDALSRERRELEERITGEALGIIDAGGCNTEPVIVVGGDGWHRGVLGIVAARLADRFQRPAYVVGFDGDTGIGSARGHGQTDLHASLSAAASSLRRFGGHRDAAGFSVHRDRFDELAATLEDHARRGWTEVALGEITCDWRLNASDLTTELLGQLERLGPFGAANPEPAFDIDGLYVLSKRVVGRDHLKLELKTPSGTVGAFGPRLGEHLDQIPELCRVAAAIKPDDWRGQGYLELTLLAPPVEGS